MWKAAFVVGDGLWSDNDCVEGKREAENENICVMLCLLWFVFVCMNDDYEGIAQRLQFREH